MQVLALVCYLLAFVAFLVAAAGLAVTRLNLVGAGLALAIFPTLVAALMKVG